MRSSLFRVIKTLNNSTSSSHLLHRGYGSEAVPHRKVAVLGAAGGIGQPLALLMKLNPLVSDLALYDIANTPGVAADVSHINTKSEVCIYCYFFLLFPLLFFFFHFLNLFRFSSVGFCGPLLYLLLLCFIWLP